MDISCLNRDNFKAEDFFNSQTAKKNHILNIPKAYQMDKIIDNLMATADKIQEVRKLLNNPIYVSSGFRCLELNRLVGSKDSSQHPKGEAIDFTCSKFGTPEKVVFFLKENNIEVDQCLVENGWVHLSIKRVGNRNQFAYLVDGKFTIIN